MIIRQKLSSLSNELCYESQVLLLIAFLATLRIAIALVLDLASGPVSYAEVLTDTGFFFLFGGLLMLGLAKRNAVKVHPAFGVVIIMLLAVNFLEFGGVKGLSRFNFYNGLAVIVLLYAGAQLNALLAFQFLLIILLTIGTATDHPWTSFFHLHHTPDVADFLFALFALGALAFYLKTITYNEIGKYQALNHDLIIQLSKEKKANKELVQKVGELRHSKVLLEKEVAARTRSLASKRNAIEEYIHINTSVLQDPIRRLNEALAGIEPGSDELLHMLHSSGRELNAVYENIRRTLESQEDLTRAKLRSS